MATVDAQHATAFDWLLSPPGPARRQHYLPGNESGRLSIYGSRGVMGASLCAKATIAGAGEKTANGAKQGA